MKTLKYSLLLLSLFALIASCKKDGALPQSAIGIKIDSSKISTTPASCDSTKLVKYVITNLTGVSSYEIAFAGKQNYTFTFPANGSTTVTVKPGTYSVFVYSPGLYTEHYFSLNAQEPAKGSGARYDNIKVTSCNGNQSFLIDN